MCDSSTETHSHGKCPLLREWVSLSKTWAKVGVFHSQGFSFSSILWSWKVQQLQTCFHKLPNVQGFLHLQEKNKHSTGTWWPCIHNTGFTGNRIILLWTGLKSHRMKGNSRGPMGKSQMGLILYWSQREFLVQGMQGQADSKDHWFPLE